MILDGVEAFVAVVETGSFARGAKRLGMPASTLSAKVARLEARLGVTLIQRTTRRLRVTGAGDAYFARCATALASLREAERELTDAREEPSGPVRVTAPANIAQSLLTPVIERFVARYPKCSVEIIATSRSVDLLAEGVDLAVRIGPLKDSSLVGRKFRSSRLRLWASKSYVERRGEPKTAAELRGHELIRFSALPRRIALHSRDETAQIEFNGRFAADDHDLVKTLILRGDGIGLLPDFVEDDASLRRRLRKILPDFSSEEMTAYFAYPVQKYVPLAVRAFIDLATAAQADR